MSFDIDKMIGDVADELAVKHPAGRPTPGAAFSAAAKAESRDRDVRDRSELRRRGALRYVQGDLPSVVLPPGTRR